ncbi:MAG: polysaccharide deacetylase family protein [PVC group bacterium]
MKRVLAKAGFYSGFFRLWLRSRRPGAFPILMYHHVTGGEEPFLPHVPVRVFARQMAYLKKNYRVRELDRLVGMVKSGEKIPARSLALTFDDEYEDVYRNAFPLLKAYRLPATIFITTGFVDTDHIPWTDELGFLFKETAKTGLEIRRGEKEKRFCWSDQASKIDVFREVKAILKTLYEEEREELFRRIKEQLAVTKKNPARILSGKEIREMARAGIDFGAHTVHHPILTRIPPRRAQTEIIDSRMQLGKIIGREVTGFCYPNGEAGDFDDVIKGMVRHAGYEYACSTIEGVNDAASDPYALKRTWTSEPSLSLFAARLLTNRG